MATAENLQFTFVSLTGGNPDVWTIYFVSIEQKEENYLQKFPGMLVITKDELICSANK